MDQDRRKILSDFSEGAHLVAYEIDGQWQAGWFRIADGKLEVRSNHQRRVVGYTDQESLTHLLRTVLTEIVHDSPVSAESRQGQELLSASLRSISSTSLSGGDTDRDREQ